MTFSFTIIGIAPKPPIVACKAFVSRDGRQLWLPEIHLLLLSSWHKCDESLAILHAYFLSRVISASLPLAVGRQKDQLCVLLQKDQLYVLLQKDQLYILLQKDQLYILLQKDQLYVLLQKDQLYVLFITKRPIVRTFNYKKTNCKYF